jgi:hypothetical protein
LYNNSDSPIDLSKYRIRNYTSAGADVSSLDKVAWKLSGTLEPRSTMVVWIGVSTIKYTVDDFNAHYGVNLVEG